MRSKRSLEGYLLIDNRCSGQGMQEAPVLTCVHCHAQVVINNLRTRERNHCRKCDAYVCDSVACNADCNGSLHKVFDDLQRIEERKLILPF